MKCDEVVRPVDLSVDLEKPVDLEFKEMKCDEVVRPVDLVQASDNP